MQRIYFLVFILVQYASGQALLSIIQSTPGTLSTLNSLINSSSTVKNLLSTANNFTFLAPSNDAFKKWLAGQGSTSPSQDVIDATLSYHLVRGGFPTVLFSTRPQFPSSRLNNPTFTNVTNGQAVELLQNGKDSEFLSGLSTLSTITSADIVCTGGLIHVIDTVLDVPQGLVTVITQSNLTFFIGILSQGGFLSIADQPLVQPVLNAPDVTFFAPNTASALSIFTSLSANATQPELGDIFKYHVVPNFVGYSSALKNGMVLRTAQGGNVTITTQGNDIFVNQAKILKTDFLVGNGVLHTIDSLLDQNNITAPAPRPAQTAQPTSSSSSTTANTINKLNTSSKIGIAVGGSAGLIIILLSVLLYVRWFKKKRGADGPRTISGPYVQELEGGRMNYHGYKEEELIDSGTIRNKSASSEDKRLEFIPAAVELDGRERSRSRSQSRSRSRGRPGRAVSKPFF